MIDICLSLHVQDFKIGNPVLSIVRSATGPSNLTLGHGVLVVSLRNQEKWIIDFVGCQCGFRDVLVPYDRYVREKRCESMGHPINYSFTETSDLDSLTTNPLLTALPGIQEKLMTERSNRLKFAEFVKTEIARKRLSDLVRSGDGFEMRLASFIEDLKRYLAS